MYKVITLTGLDRTGKATQANLLSLALFPAKLRSFPDYHHWTGQIIRAILSEENFTIQRGAMRPEQERVYQQTKEPYLFQALQFANSRAHTTELLAGLAHHHWVLDRGPACAHAYGVVDGCEPQFLRELSRYVVPEDLVLVLLGGPYARPGEVPDLNERNPVFQETVASRYRTLCERAPETWVEIPLALANGFPKLEAITMVHHMICRTVQERLGPTVLIRPLRQGEVEATLIFPETGALLQPEPEIVCDGC